MHPYRKFLYFLRVCADLVVVAISFDVSVWLAYAHYSEGTQSSLAIGLLFLEAMWLISSQFTRLYDEFRTHIGFGKEFVALMKCVLIEGIAAGIFLFIIKETVLSRFFVLVFLTSTAVLATAEKYVVKQLFLHMRRRGRNLRTVLFVGASRVTHKICETIDSNPQFGYRIVGVLSDKKTPSLNGQYLGPLNKLERILDERRIDDVFVTLPYDDPEKVQQIAGTCGKYTTRVQIVPDCFAFLPARYSLSIFDRLPLVALEDDKVNELHWRAMKRLFDLVFSTAVILFLFSWLFPIVAIAIRLSSHGPIFFEQERGGRRGKRFKALKFRTMKQDSADIGEDGKFRQAKADDPRITKVGKFLRRTNLDELPQFLNVFKGEMSIVGPRPHATLMDFESKQKADRYMRRHLTKPGITGWAQVHGYRGEIHDPEELLKRVELDIWYIENWSFWLDVKIILLTIWQMIRGDPKAY